MTKTFQSFQWTLVVKWTAVTAVAWLLAHPLAKELGLVEVVLLPALVIVPLAAAVSLARALGRRLRNVDPGWRAIATNTGWAAVVIFSLALWDAASIAGVLQWLLLRRYISNSTWWILASSLGVFISLIVSNVAEGIDVVELVLLVAPIPAVMQWLVLRREVSLAGWWIPASIIGWLVGLLGAEAVLSLEVLITISDTVSEHLDIDNTHVAVAVTQTVPRLVGGVLCGFVTGISLAGLLKHLKQRDVPLSLGSHEATVTSEGNRGSLSGSGSAWLLFLLAFSKGPLMNKLFYPLMFLLIIVASLYLGTYRILVPSPERPSTGEPTGTKSGAPENVLSPHASRVKKIIAEQLGIDEKKVIAEASFGEDLGADSLDMVELIMALEEEFRIEIPDEDACRIEDVGDAIIAVTENQSEPTEKK